MATTKTVEWAVGQSENQNKVPAFHADPTCMRCGGLMVRDFCTDLLTPTGGLDCVTARCVQCGDVVDPVIRSNRHLQHAAAARGMKQSSPALQERIPVLR